MAYRHCDSGEIRVKLGPHIYDLCISGSVTIATFNEIVCLLVTTFIFLND